MPDPEFREFNFLPNLPKSNLDDRTFEDLVQECILRIPRYCPEWTNHNPGDPGITLIELFSWLVDQMLLRFNQVPRRNYVAFLELLGIRLHPPSAAHGDITFYLTKPTNQSPLRIPAYTEVATIRTESEPAVVFTTDKELIVGQPQIQGLFTSRQAELFPSQFNTVLQRSDATQWDSLGEVMLFETCEFENCFYVVLAPTNPASQGSLLNGRNGNAGANGSGVNNSNNGSNGNGQSVNSERDAITGNILSLRFKGVIAGTTGINPDDPPLDWQYWNGEEWKSGILRQVQDDRTKGFSFHELRQQGTNAEQVGADVVLHLPQQWPSTDFGTGCHGHWVRCVYRQARETQYPYSRSPSIRSISVEAIGGVIHASECVRVENELLGTSNGKAGQVFYLQNSPLIQCEAHEHIQVRYPDGRLEDWQEVSDFGDSDASSRHYMVDAQNGMVQFGPLIREPSQLRQQTRDRTQLQPWGKQIRHLSRAGNTLDTPLLAADEEGHQYQEWQYGQVPPLGAEIYMTSYRVGGGSRGNVQKETLTVLRTAIPYVKRVTNYYPAQGGEEGERLDEAVIRVPQVLRTSQAAVTPADFEAIAKQVGGIYRAHCPPVRQNRGDVPGVVRLLIVPLPPGKPNPHTADFRHSFPDGMNPDDCFSLDRMSSTILEQLDAIFDERKPLGIQVNRDIPVYVGVKVIAEVWLEPEYSHHQTRLDVQSRLLSMLYRFLNPITGGFEQTGWELGRPLSASDVVARLQEVPEVRYVGAVKLFPIRKHSSQLEWIESNIPEMKIVPGDTGILCSWEDNQEGVSRFGHEIHLME